MCFCFGLEILRLVYKKAFFKILYGFYLIWSFSLRKKWVALPLIRVEKNFFKSPHSANGTKRSGILHWFQKCAEVLSLAKGGNNF